MAKLVFVTFANMDNFVSLDISPNEKLYPTNGYVILAVDKEFDNQIGENFKFTLDTTYNPLHHITISGIVIATPPLPDDSYAFRIDESHPMAKSTHDGDRISEKLKGYPSNAVTDIVKLGVRKAYRPTDYKAVIQTYEDQKVNIRPGDKVYFNYLTVDPDNYLGKDEKGRHVYKCIYSQIYCRVRKKKITALNGYVLVNKEIDNTDFVEANIQGTPRLLRERKIVDDSGNLQTLIVQLDPRRVTEQGWVNQISRDMECGRMRPEVNTHDKIAFKKYSDFINKIEGKEVYVMKAWDIVAYQVRNKWVPVEEMLLIQPIKPKKKGTEHLHSIDMPTINTGEVKSVGSKVTRFTVGDVVIFGPEHRYIVTEELIAIPENFIPIKKHAIS